MEYLSGEIGTLLLNGEQVGGFKYWYVTMDKNPLHTQVYAHKFWKLKEINTEELTAEFYRETEYRLKSICKRPIKLSLPESEINKIINKRICMDLGDYDWINA